MIWSLPPETTRPSGKEDEGGTMASELTNSLPCVLMELSQTGGLADCCVQARTVKSLEAEKMEAGDAKATLRT